jgi:tetraacyldisaccharide 4'-kinase
MTRALLAPLELLYSAALRLKNQRYDKGSAEHLAWPVVSVGNLSMGGAGKTPVVIRLAQLLTQAGWHVDVLSRGYGRSGNKLERIHPESPNPAGDPAARVGDEPLLIAQSARVPVYVGASRFAAGKYAESELADGFRHVHLLDDGFQHRQLARSVDIVVVHRDDLRDRLIPAGRLREPLASLRRADAVVVRAEDRAILEKLGPALRTGTAVWTMHRRLIPPEGVHRAVAFCAIARPQEFFTALASVGLQLEARFSFRDHHRYTEKDMDRIAQAGKQLGCDAFVTTEKDAVKLSPGLHARLAKVAPMHAVRLAVEFENEARLMKDLLGMLPAEEQLPHHQGASKL